MRHYASRVTLHEPRLLPLRPLRTLRLGLLFPLHASSPASRFTSDASRAFLPTGYCLLDTGANGPIFLRPVFDIKLVRAARNRLACEARIRQVSAARTRRTRPAQAPYSNRVPTVLRARTPHAGTAQAAAPTSRSAGPGAPGSHDFLASRFTNNASRGKAALIGREPRITSHGSLVSPPAEQGQSVTWKVGKCREEGNREQGAVISSQYPVPGTRYQVAGSE